MLHRTISLTVIASIALTLAFSGCASMTERTDRVRTVFVNDVKIRVSLPPEGNERTGIAVDFLTVHNAELAAKLMETDAKTWFSAKNQFKNDYTAGKDFDIEEREYAPGSFVRPVELPWRSRRTVLLIYADYRSPGPHRFRANQRQELILTLGEKEFSVVPKN
ncbi:MAG: hypothetical protein FWG73_01080 [Planctomycetaceae bacterium]|nr:hypothetical protein [Planctomycetaceae bacterium]